MDVEAEIRELRRRVGELEGGWGFLTGQVRAVHVDLLDFKAETEERFDKVDQRLDRVENDVKSLKTDVQSLKTDVQSLRDDLPSIVGGAMREVLDERGRG